jgi:hypothetical protein
MNVFDQAFVAAAATLVAALIGLLAVLLVAWINARAGRTTARLNALRDYRQKQATDLVEFMDRRLRDCRVLESRRVQDRAFEAWPTAVNMVANDNLAGPALGATGDGAVQDSFSLFMIANAAFVNTLRLCEERTPQTRRLMTDADAILVQAATLLRTELERWVFGTSAVPARRRSDLRKRVEAMLKSQDDQLVELSNRPSA